MLCSQPASLLKGELRWRKVKFGATGKPKSQKRRSRRSPRPPPRSRRLRLRPRRNSGKNSAAATSSPQQSGWAHWPVAVAALRVFSASKKLIAEAVWRRIQGAGNWRSGAGRCDKTTGLFLTDQTACHIDPAIGPDHARDPDTILVFASSGAAELKSWTHAMRIGRFSFAGVLRWPVNLGYWGDGHRRREHCRTKAGDGDTCQGAFKSLSSERLVRLNHGSTGPGLLMVRRD